MTDMEILEEMIKIGKNAPADTGRIKQRSSVALQENNTRAKYSVTLTDMPDDFFIFKPELSSLSAMFKCDNGECRFADYIIVAGKGKKKRIIYIELKASDNHDDGYIVDQLKGAECFTAYCKAIGDTFWGGKNKNFLEGYKARYILMENLGARKRGISGDEQNSPRPTPYHTPDRPTVFRGCISLDYSELVA